jgi:nicotinamidase-related amidase
LSLPPYLQSSRITDADLAAYEAAGFRNSVGFGVRPAVLVIDTQYRSVGPRKPILEAIAESGYGPATGERGWRAIDHLAPLLHAAREKGVPVMFPCVAPKLPETAGGIERLNPKIANVDQAGYEFIAEVAPLPGELIIPKHGPSSFFGTPLASFLVKRGVDTVILTGCTTSGCVRATAVDASSLAYRTIVAADSVYDRADVSHEVGLFELDAKYADVLPTADIIAYLESL